MPNIQGYEDQVEPFSPIETERASSQAGQGLENLGQGIQNLGKGVTTFEEHKDIAQSAAQTSDIQVKYQTQIKNLTHSMNDDQKHEFLQGVQNDLQNLQNNVSTGTGQDFTAKQSRLTMDSVSVALAAKNASLYGQEIGQGITTAANNQSHLVAMDTGPTQYKNSIQSLDALNVSDASQPFVERAKSMVAQNRVQAIMKNDPDQADKLLASGDLDGELNETQKNQLSNQINAWRTAQDRIATKATGNVKDALIDADKTNFLKSLYVDHTATIDSVMAYKNASPDDKVKMIHEMGNFASGGGVTTDIPTYMNIKEGILKGTVNSNADIQGQSFDVNGVQKVAGKGTLELQKLLKNRLTPEGESESSLKSATLAIAKKELTGGGLVPDPQGLRQYYQFSQDMEKTLQTGVQNGKPIALQLTQSINGKPNPDWVGSSIGSYRRSVQDVAQSTVSQVQGQPQARPVVVDNGPNQIGLPQGAPPTGQVKPSFTPPAMTRMINAKGENVQVPTGRVQDALKAKWKLR